MQGELQQFVFPYTVIPTFREKAGYGELKKTLNPRWYIAARSGFTSAKASGQVECLEGAAAFRPDRLQLIKFDYEYEHYSSGTYRNENTLAIQFVTTLHFSAARD